MSPTQLTLKQIRLNSRKSRDEIASSAKLSRKQLTLIEAGKVLPRDATILKLADALCVEPAEVVAAIEISTADAA